jgi:hypothetical protein
VELAAEENKNTVRGGPRFPIRYDHMSRPNTAFDFFHDYRDMISRYAVQDRFHLGGLVWHDHVITPASLSIINGWLAAQGSMLVVLIARDQVWYESHLVQLAGSKPEMFSVGKMMEGNRKFIKLIDDKVIQADMAFDVSGGVYLQDSWLKDILKVWFNRLELLERFP